jgi:hypothetical protein
MVFVSIVRSGLSLVNVICTPFWEIELCDMGPEMGVYNRASLCISEVVSDEDLKIIYKEGSKNFKYVALLCVHASALYLYSTSLCFINSI